MPDPLASDIVARLKSDPTAALAAALILAGSFPDLVSWAVRLFSGKDGAADCEPKASGAGGSNGVAWKAPRSQARGQHAPRETAARHDQALLALMRANPDVTVTELIRMSGRPRNSAVLSLERLEKAGSSSTPSVENGRRWILSCWRFRRLGRRRGSNLCRAAAWRNIPPAGACPTGR